MEDERISREDFYYGVAQLAAQRSTCRRGHVGAVAVRDQRIVATGYNGSPPGADHCLESGCDLSLGEDAGCQRAIHAEANLVAWAARSGVSLEGTAVYCTHSPCWRCAVLLIQSGIKTYHFISDYRAGALDMLWRANIWTQKRGESIGITTQL